MLLTDLADAARKSGLPVHEVDGWQHRGHGHLYDVNTIACHHTATPRTAPGNYPSLRIVRDGRTDLPGPLAQLGLGRDGTVYVIAAGVAYHAGATWRPEQDNWHAIGIEAEHDGVSPWPEPLVDAYARLCAALIDHYGLTVSDVQGHKEIAEPAGRKIDPNFDMDAFRVRVRMADTEDDMANYADQLDRIEKQNDRILKRLDADAVIRERLKQLVKQGRAERRDLEELLDLADGKESERPARG